MEDPYVFLRSSIGGPVKLSIFKDTLFNSSIQPLICSSCVARTTTTPKLANKRFIMTREKNGSSDKSQNRFSLKDHMYTD